MHLAASGKRFSATEEKSKTRTSNLPLKKGGERRDKPPTKFKRWISFFGLIEDTYNTEHESVVQTCDLKMFRLKVFITVSRVSTSIHGPQDGRAAGSAYGFQSAGGDLIIVMRLWVYIWKRRNIKAALYLLHFYLLATRWPGTSLQTVETNYTITNSKSKTSLSIS